MKLKKWVALATAAAMCLSMTACSVSVSTNETPLSMRIFFQSSLQDLHRLVWRTIIHKDVFNVIKRLGEQRFSAPLNIFLYSINRYND